MNSKQITTLWCAVIVEELIRQGAGFFCISPGSRSTPLTLAVASNPKARFRMFPDERSAGFYALGYARATGMPAALVCTSGTAVANYFPAVVEASADAQPMLVLSADRPFELLECGANQTIRQQDMFGSYTRWSFELPEPGMATPLASLLSTIDQAVKRSLGSPAGPVHLNLPFREPLEPEAPDYSHPWAAPLEAWRASGEPWSRFALPLHEPGAESIVALREILAGAERPLLVAGNMSNAADGEAVAALADSLGVPLLADLTSGIRLSANRSPWQLAFQNEAFTDSFRPDVVLHFGGPLIGKQPALAIRKHPPMHYVIVREHPGRLGPDHNVTLTIEASPASVASALEACRVPLTGLECRDAFSAASGIIDEMVCKPGEAVNEISAPRIVSSLAGDGHALFVANSMPARDMDLYAAPVAQKPLQVALNRGVSGIDGIISTAAGFSAGLRKPATLFIGDISFLHDLNALSLLGHPWNPLIVIVLNNNGGGIFSFLPIASVTDRLDECFAAPQNFSVELAARTFGLDYACPPTNRDFTSVYAEALKANRSLVIEVKSDRQQNFLLHRAIKAQLDPIFGNAGCIGAR
ncbi:2-succinyl-5-enolpyruvyl-6-hydroxy-3-cyclohexene-1-carboxylic-acid synthase [Chlorobaculum limnaeum]|uniref:2-succinyl-5-enolpyruvyl-6-hydroxy-3-cyclohexene-1-carboxylate synthase n=1 Tax=Chlorobaculum limnaeum TaxID=274537 RepID=A0A1D8CZQ7_CHLLM|nr:2-succinyl-5-enolpyruvyl-6-hydroxy-3-cyclohexene-1-carboxylic-acid synthase [Chlorobaculum limnaeum]AOS84422.1 2-succinyl-5-enolpyruvyl-6-hydroxy-3-cyclohexene-1-carboxylic-acid synthase [Chlorobaculum limnaeum]